MLRYHWRLTGGVMEPDDDGDLESLLRASDPVGLAWARIRVSRLNTDLPRTAVDERRLTRVLRRVRRGGGARRRAWSVVVVLLGTAVAAPGSPVTASWLYQTQTGEHGQGGDAVEGSEWLDTQASDFTVYAMSLYPEWLPLPEGVDSDSFRAAEASGLAQSVSGGYLQDVSVRFRYEIAAQCLWQDEYLTSAAQGRSLRAAAALDILDRAASWPAIVASDGGGIAQAMEAMAVEARRGDDTLMAKRIGCADSWTLKAYGVER